MSVQRGPVPDVGFITGGSAGRLANTCFQFAAAVGLARRFGTTPILGPADWPYRKWFSIDPAWFPDPPPAVTSPERFARNLSPRARIYLQDLTLWSNAVDEVLAMFAPSPEATVLVDEACATFAHLPRPLVACHIRRGDTISRNPPDTIQPLPASYFVEAAARWEPASVVCFSDDARWCKEALPDSWHVYEGVPGPEDFEDDYASRERFDHVDLQAMARIGREDGAGLVISNSSFGLWSALLARTDRTCAPSRWFGRKLSHHFHPRHFLLPSWTTVQVIE